MCKHICVIIISIHEWISNGGQTLSEELKLVQQGWSHSVSALFLLALNDNQEPTLATPRIVFPVPNMFQNLARRVSSICVNPETLIEIVRVFCALVLGSSKFMMWVYNYRSNCEEISTTEQVIFDQEKGQKKWQFLNNPKGQSSR